MLHFAHGRERSEGMGLLFLTIDFSQWHGIGYILSFVCSTSLNMSYLVFYVQLYAIYLFMYLFHLYIYYVR